MKQDIHIADCNFLVFVRCMTYNQSQYILDALNGFVMQKTNFPFVCLVMDDASTDGEPEVIKGFLDRECAMESAEFSEIEEANIIVVPHRTNPNCTMAVYFLKKNLYGTDKKTPMIAPWRERCKYEAICEGDDYWIDSEKLQKQVDFLESNDNFSMCCSEAVVLSPEGEQDWRRYESSRQVPPKDMIIGGGLFVQTASLLFRESLYNGYPAYCINCHVGDYPLKLWGAINGGLYCFSEKMVVYRFATRGSWTSNVSVRSVENLLPCWKSEVLMLDGLNKYSNGVYSYSFNRRIREYIWYNLFSHEAEWRTISLYFHDWIRLFPRRHRVVDFLFRIRLKWLYSLCKKHFPGLLP